MIKTIIATLILLTFPLLSQADMGVYEGVSIGANTDMDVSVSNFATTTSNIDNPTNNSDISTYTSTEIEGEVEAENDGFFRKIINWFKGWFN